ncbi:MAG: acyltransferase [Calditrichaeota bacterium]|nr:acyltransferase [Calditrichota bacterium]MCB9365656.1 acyltransferase [Calditrichota bacterium]
MILGIVQTDPVFGDIIGNQIQVERLLGNHKADLWVLPELALTGYETRGRAESLELSEELPHGPSAKWLHQLCRDRNCHMIMGLIEREGDKVYNGSVFIGPDGMVGRYRKVHLFDKEVTRFDPGDIPFNVYDIGVARVGIMICFDWRFPEVMRTLALRGGQIVAHPSNLVLPYCQAAMVTRCFENNVFAATANRIGTEERDDRSVSFTGRSVIVGTQGELLASAAVDATDVLLVDIDPTRADIKTINPYNDTFGTRRAEFYEI